MSYETDFPYAVADTTSAPHYAVVRYERREMAEWYLGYLKDHGGSAARKKVENGGYAVEGPGAP